VKQTTMRLAVTSMDNILSRRSAIRVVTTAGVTLAALVMVGPAFAQPARESPTVSVNANLRSGPGADHAVITVIPKGAAFTLTGEERNSFRGVTYNGTSGWVYAPLVMNAGSKGDPAMVGEAYTTSPVNLRSGPGTSHTVLQVIAAGATLNVSNTVQHGFRYVVHDGLAGWLAEGFIAWRSGTGAGTVYTTTAPLNLRAEPSEDAQILLVMPPGSPVTAADGESNGFRKVTFMGATGWASTAYLVRGT
jgi:uncharacterized protein YraI